MSRSDTDRREAEASRILIDLAIRMERVGIRLPALIGHLERCDAHAAELLRAADWVRHQGERLK